VIFTMVGFPADLRQVVLEDNGIIHGARPGSILVDMTTSEPVLARELYDTLKARGIASIDAPVSGGDVGARNATLSIMVGGDKEVIDALMPLFQCMGKLIVHHGPAGSGQHAKMCNQVLIASTMVAVCECLLYGYKAGLDLHKVIQSVGSGAAGSWAINNLGPKILQRNFDPGFFVEHFLKDMGIALAEAGRMNIVLPGLAMANQLYLSVEALGHGRSGTQALMLALERLSNLEINPERPNTHCLCCQKGTETRGVRVCPVCGHEFQGKGWDGIDAHWRAKHESTMPYEQFWSTLCEAHRG
jgi:3-hydroxyisobutyrate dehydrogenase